MLPTIAAVVVVMAGVIALVVVVANSSTGKEISNALAAGDNRTYIQESIAMAPTIEAQDHVGATTSFSTILRGQVVVLDTKLAGAPPSVGTVTLKRVVGLPGETIACTHGIVTINGTPLPEPYVPSGGSTPDFAAVTIPAGHYWVMGDNRENSLDSREFGPVARSAVIAIVNRILSPASRAGPIPFTPR